MNIAAKVGLGVAGLLGAGALGACTQRNENKTPEDVLDDLTNRGVGYHRDHDGLLDVGTESTRDEPGSTERYIFDSNQDGFLGVGDMSVTDHYVNRYSIENLTRAADEKYGPQLGTRDGKASVAEMAKVIAEYDTGPTSAKDKAIAGNSILERSEIKRFNDSRFNEKFKERIDR